MHSYRLILLGAVAAAQSPSSDLLSSLGSRTDVSIFREVLEQAPDLIDDLLAPALSASGLRFGGQVTLLVPNDNAIQEHAETLLTPAIDNDDDDDDDLLGSGIFGLDFIQTALLPTLRYHILAAPLKAENFSDENAPRGLTVPTFLDGLDTREEDEEDAVSFNLRSPAPSITEQFGEGATGQVLFAQTLGGAERDVPVVKLRTRQDGEQQPLSSLFQAGLGQEAEVEMIDGEFSGGIFHIVNSILSPPAPCSNTIRTLSDTLTSIDEALNRTSLWSTLNTTPNVTCLAPDSDAFSAAGNPQVNLPEDELRSALLDHVLVGPTYSNLLVNGMTIDTASNKTVQITVNETGTFFNDAKVLRLNVLTNNGLVHILDRLMTVEAAPATSDDDSSSGDDDSSSGDGSSSDDSSSDESNDGSSNENDNAAGIVAVSKAMMAGVLAFAYLVHY